VKKIILVLLVIIGGLFATRVLNRDFSIDKVKLIFDMPSIRDSILQHQKDAIYLPYRLRLFLFNDSVYIYQILRNIANFWSLTNINKIILLANVYPMILGFMYLKKNRWLIILGIVAGSLVIGINKMVDARAATWLILPIFIYLIFMGIRKINLKIYISLLIVSLFLLL
jgi:hypothetical protein